MPLGYTEGLQLYTHTHSREVLQQISMGRPILTYDMIEKDIIKAKETWSLPLHGACIAGVDNNQCKISSWDAKRKETTVRKKINLFAMILKR